MEDWGHANALRQSKLKGDYLVVGVHTDEEVMHHKGKPLFPDVERYELVRACRWVDEVVEGAPYITKLEVLDSHNIDYCTHGEDISYGADGKDTYLEIKEADRMRTINRSYGISTTDLCSRILGHGKGAPGTSSSSDHFLCTSSMISAFHPRYSPAGGSSVSFKAHRLETDENELKDSKVIYVNGTWDLLNVGHLDVLREAKNAGDYVIVGVLPDECTSTGAPKVKPFMNLLERVLLVLAMRYVDDVIIGSPYRIDKEFIDQLGLNVVISGETDKKREAEMYGEAMKVGIYKRIERVRDIDTESVTRRILSQSQSYEERQARKGAQQTAQEQA